MFKADPDSSPEGGPTVFVKLIFDPVNMILVHDGSSNSTTTFAAKAWRDFVRNMEYMTCWRLLDYIVCVFSHAFIIA
jgi:hypothetical protein